MRPFVPSQHHIRNTLKFGVQPVVAVNRFSTDTEAEVALVKAAALEAGAFAAVEANHWALGGAGAVDLARAVVDACAAAKAAAASGAGGFRFLYPIEMGLKDKIAAIALGIYGAAGVEYSPEAEERLAFYTALGASDTVLHCSRPLPSRITSLPLLTGYDKLPICMAKTQYSLSTDPSKKGVPTGFSIVVRDVRASVGAGFVYPLLGAIQTVPGLPTRPGFYDVDLEFDPEDEDKARIVGLF